jgi:hypothetical protein
MPVVLLTQRAKPFTGVATLAVGFSGATGAGATVLARQEADRLVATAIGLTMAPLTGEAGPLLWAVRLAVNSMSGPVNMQRVRQAGRLVSRDPPMV